MIRCTLDRRRCLGTHRAVSPKYYGPVFEQWIDSRENDKSDALRARTESNPISSVLLLPSVHPVQPDCCRMVRPDRIQTLAFHVYETPIDRAGSWLCAV